MYGLIILIFSFIAVLMSIAMFFVPKEKKIALLFVSVMTLSALKMWVISALDLLIISFIISEYKNYKAILNQTLRNKTTKIILYIILLMFVLDIFFSSHLHSAMELFKYFDLFIFRKYLLFFIAYYTIKATNNTTPLIHYSIIAMCVLTLFGIINFIQKESDIVSAFVSINKKSYFLEGNAFSLSNRFRVQSMFINPFDYGFICCACLLLYIETKKIIGNRLFIAMLLCCLFGIFSCGCRTIIICAIVSVLVYLFINYKIIKFIRFAFLLFSLSALSYLYFPYVTEKVNSVVKIFNDDDYGGSSISMRTVQFATVFGYIKDNPLLGKGVGFFNEDLGWDKGDRSRKDSDLQGLEGVYLGRLLEHGIIGYILYLMVWIIIFISLKKHIKVNRKLAGLGIAIWAAYSCFANMTGELLSVAPTLILIGSIMGLFPSKHFGTPIILIRNK